MRIGLIRHGETDWNAQSRLQGTTDIALNERGMEQAREAGRLLQHTNWTRLYCSPLVRTRTTAELIAREAELPHPVAVDEFIERSFGELEGLSVYYEDGSRRPLDHPSIEPKSAVVDRVLPKLQQIAGEHPDEDALVITHGSVVRLVLDTLLPFPAPHITNLGFSVLETNPTMPHGFAVVTANGYPVLHPTQVAPAASASGTEQASV